MTSFSARQGVAAQMYSLREHLKKDWEKTVREVARTGYHALQVSAMAHCPTADLVKLVTELKLKVIGEHVGLPVLQNDLPGVIQRSVALDCTWVFLPNMPQALQTPEGYNLVGDFLNTLANRFHPFGLQAGYHNHAFEFDTLANGLCGYEMLLKRCRVDVVMELDTYWAKKGGKDPAGYMIEHLQRRLDVLHIKDMAADGKFAEVGHGTLDWPSIFHAADVVGTHWMVVEQDDCYGRDPLESLGMSLQFLRSKGFTR